MALSFSRPDPSSPSEVGAAVFTVARRGYDQAEVRDLLRMVAAEMARLQEREKFLERELRTAQRGQPNIAVALDDEVVTKMLGEEAARILQTAREAGSQIKMRAEDGASRLLREATDEAQRMREEASVEASRRRSDANSDAEAELHMAKQQGREMVNEARAYRERVLSELARRRELARQQIEQLIHGRDRLLQAFERARLSAVDVMAELTPLGEPNEYVNLSPTTGPVPVMVPADRLRMVEPPMSDVAAASGHPVHIAGPDVVADDSLIDRVDDRSVDIDIDVAETADADEYADFVVEGLDDDLSGADDESEDGHADVVPLFGHTHTDSTDAEEIDADAAVAAALTSDDAPTDAVDDMFQRLRAARAQSIAERVSAAVATDTPADDDAHAGSDGVRVLRRELRVIGDDPSVFMPSPEAPADITEVDEDSPFGRRNAALTPMIVAVSRKLKRVLADEQNDVLATLRRNQQVHALDTLLPWATEQADRYVNAVEDDLTSAAAAGADSVEPDGANRNRLNRPETLQPVTEQLRTALVEPLRERLDRAIGQAADNADLADRARTIYREWKVQRIDEQVEHLMHLAFGRGAYAVLTPGTPVCWMVDPDGPVCADAEDNALEGTVRVGDAFPTGQPCAPAHDGCRCMLVRAD
jgi:DivIVA domain-containing protein